MNRFASLAVATLIVTTFFAGSANAAECGKVHIAVIEGMGYHTLPMMGTVVDEYPPDTLATYDSGPLCGAYATKGGKIYFVKVNKGGPLNEIGDILIAERSLVAQAILEGGK